MSERTACTVDGSRMRYVLVGDGESPHLLKWARALASRVDLYVLSSRGFLPELAALVAPEKRLALATRPSHAGGNIGLLRQVPKVARWLAWVNADWINPHYLTSHGTLVWLARRWGKLRGRVLASAWGSDILLTPERNIAYRWLTQAVVRQADLCTSDSVHVTERLQAFGAKQVSTFVFGLEAMPAPATEPKQEWLFFTNRGLEPIYRPQRVLDLFARIAKWQPKARLVIANTGSLQAVLQQQVKNQGLAEKVQFVGRLDAQTQAHWYDKARWYISQPESDAVAVSVLEAMAHGCLPLLSDLPANRELVTSMRNGWLVPDEMPSMECLSEALQLLQRNAINIEAENSIWISSKGLFYPHIEQLLYTLETLHMPR